jgi:hypothetical protein
MLPWTASMNGSFLVFIGSTEQRVARRVPGRGYYCRLPAHARFIQFCLRARLKNERASPSQPSRLKRRGSVMLN